MYFLKLKLNKISLHLLKQIYLAKISNKIFVKLYYFMRPKL